MPVPPARPARKGKRTMLPMSVFAALDSSVYPLTTFSAALCSLPAFPTVAPFPTPLPFLPVLNTPILL